MISGATRIAPLAISSIARGYSPADAQLPTSDNSRVTTSLQRQRHLGRKIADQSDLPAAADAADCRGQWACGPDDFQRHVDARGRRSRSSTAATASHLRRIERLPSRQVPPPSRRRSSSRSMAITWSQPASPQRLNHQTGRSCRCRRPPRCRPVDPQPPTACSATDTGSTRAACSNGNSAGSAIDRLLRHDDKLGKRACWRKSSQETPSIRRPAHMFVLPAAAQLAFAAGEQRIEGHVIAGPTRVSRSRRLPRRRPPLRAP